MERTLLYDWKAPLDPEAGYETPLHFPDRAVRALESARNYLRVNFSADKDKRHHFSMVLRRGWFLIPPQNLPGDPPGFKSIARLMLKDVGGPVHLSVQASSLRRELTAADWLNLLLAAQKIHITHRRAYQTPGGAQLEVLGLIRSLGKPWVARLTAIKDGDRVFFLRAWCTLSRYDAFAEDFFTALQSFRLHNPASQPYAEPLTERRLGVGSLEHAVEMRFKLPASWQTEEERKKRPAPSAKPSEAADAAASSPPPGLPPPSPGDHGAANSQSLLSAFSAASSAARGLTGAAQASSPLSAMARGLSGTAQAASAIASVSRGGSGAASTTSTVARGLGGAVGAAAAVSAVARGGVSVPGLLSAAAAISRGGQALANAASALSKVKRARTGPVIPDPADVNALLAPPSDDSSSRSGQATSVAPPEFDDEPKILILRDTAKSGELRAGLLRREPGLKRATVLNQVLTFWAKSGLEIDRSPTIEGPYPVEDPDLTGQFWEFKVQVIEPPAKASSSRGAPIEAPEPPRKLPTTLRVVILGHLSAWIWAGYLGPRPDAPAEAAPLGRRAFELLLKELKAAHPGMLPQDEERQA